MTRLVDVRELKSELVQIWRNNWEIIGRWGGEGEKRERHVTLFLYRI